MTGKFHILGWLVGAIFCSGCQSEKQETSLNAEPSLQRVQALEDANEARRQELLRAIAAAESDNERQQIKAAFGTYWLGAIDEMLGIAEREPASAVGKRAAIWVVTRSDPDSRPHKQATKLLLKYHADAEELGGVCQNLFGFSPLYEQFLRAVTSSTTSAAVRGPAAYHLAELLLLRSEFKATMDATPELSAERERNMGQDVVAFLTATDREVDRSQAIALLERVCIECSDIPYGNSTLGAAASERLKSLQQTFSEIGSAAPETVGESLDGKELKLSAYRGKVVVLTFWASWCAACLDRVPEENRLADELADSPFALLGVNGDRSIEDAQAAVTKHGIRFDSWWDNPNAEPTIVNRWNVRQWPTTFVLDSTGVLRYRDLAGPELRSAVLELLAQENGGNR